jgi:hypothetical protein
MSTGKLPEADMAYDEFRAMITRHAYQAQERYGELVNQAIDNRRAGKQEPLTAAEDREMRTSHHAAMYGWSTVSLLGFIRDRLDDDAAFEAALMLDDMGANGDAPFTDDLPYPPVPAPADV